MDLRTTALEWFYRSTSRAVWGFYFILFFSLSFFRELSITTPTQQFCAEKLTLTLTHFHLTFPTESYHCCSYITTLNLHTGCSYICVFTNLRMCVHADACKRIHRVYFFFWSLWCLFSQDTVGAHPFVFVCKTAGWVRLAVIYYNFTKAGFLPLALVWEVLLTVVGGKITGLIRAKNLISQHRGEDVKFISSCSPTFEDGFGVGSQTSYKVDPVEEILMKCCNQPPPRVSFPTIVFLKCLRDITKRAFHKTQESFQFPHLRCQQRGSAAVSVPITDKGTHTHTHTPQENHAHTHTHTHTHTCKHLHTQVHTHTHTHTKKLR